MCVGTCVLGEYVHCVHMPLCQTHSHSLNCVLVNKFKHRRKLLIVGGALLYPLFEKQEKFLLK